METFSGRLIAAGVFVLVLGFGWMFYTQVRAERWDSDENIRKLDYHTDRLQERRGLPIKPDPNAFKTADEMFGTQRWVAAGVSGVGVLLIIVGWAASPRKAEPPTQG